MDELLKRRNELKRKLSPLEWDMMHKQINYARELELKAYRQELEKIESEIAGDQNGKTI